MSKTDLYSNIDIIITAFFKQRTFFAGTNFSVVPIALMQT